MWTLQDQIDFAKKQIAYEDTHHNIINQNLWLEELKRLEKLQEEKKDEI